MQFTVKKRYVDPKLKLGLLMCLFVGGFTYYNENHISDFSLILCLSLLLLIFVLIVPYIINSIILNILRLMKNQWIDYKYFEFGDNGLFFTYWEKDIRFDTNIRGIKVQNYGFDYMFDFGNGKKAFIYGEKGESWKGEANYSFMYLAKLIARAKYAKLPVNLTYGWKIKSISEDLLKGKKFDIYLKEANFSFEKILLNKDGIKISKNNKDFLIENEKIKCNYIVKTPKENYWLSCFGFSNKYLVSLTVNGWLVCKI